MNARAIALSLAASSLLLGAACGELAEPRDVTGNFVVEYENNLRVYLNDELVAEVTEGEDADIEWNGETFQLSQLCSEEGVECPDETFWGDFALDQPYGPESILINFVNLDTELGEPGQRMGGTLENDNSFAMLSGLGLAGNGACVTLGIGTVTGQLSADAQSIEDGVITYQYSTGCNVAGFILGATIRLETDVRADRYSDYDVSSVEAEMEAPIDEEGEEIEPELSETE